MFRKVTFALLAVSVIAGGLTVAPASAATKISNGVACSKANATTKVSGYTYKCFKNALVKNAKLTWLSSDCVDALNAWTDGVKLKAANVPGNPVYEKNQAGIASRAAALAQANTAYTNLAAAIATDTAALNAETDATKRDALVAKIAQEKLTLTKLADARAKLGLTVKNDANSATILDGIIKDAKEQAKVLCTKGF